MSPAPSVPYFLAWKSKEHLAEVLAIAVIKVPLAIALLVGMYKQMKGCYGRKRNRGGGKFVPSRVNVPFMELKAGRRVG